MSLCLGKFEDRPTMPYSTPPGEEDLEYVSEELPDPKSLDFNIDIRHLGWRFGMIFLDVKHLFFTDFHR